MYRDRHWVVLVRKFNGAGWDGACHGQYIRERWFDTSNEMATNSTMNAICPNQKVNFLLLAIGKGESDSSVVIRNNMTEFLLVINLNSCLLDHGFQRVQNVLSIDTKRIVTVLVGISHFVGVHVFMFVGVES